MYINGTSLVHSAQSLRAPHRAPAASPPGASSSFGVDELDISSEADFVSQVHDLPDIRADRVAQIRAQIQAGVYETPDKISKALDSLLDEIA